MSDAIETNPVGTESQAPVGSPDLAAQLELVKSKNAELIKEKQRVQATFDDLQKQIAELKDNSTKQKQAKLAEEGRYGDLWKEAQQTNAQLQEQIAQLQREKEEMAVAHQQTAIKAAAVSAFTQQGVQAPDQMYQLLKDNLRQKDGSTFVLHGGVEVPLGDHLNNLKSPGSGWEHHFSSSGARGMGAAGSTPTALGGGENPYVTKSFAKIVELEATNPELAMRMKAQAGL